MSENLNDVNKGERAVITGIDGLNIKRIKRLYELGFAKNEVVEVLKKNKNIILVGIRGYAICLDKEIACHIQVKL